MTTLDFLKELGIEKVNFGGYSDKWLGSGSELDSVTPVDGTLIAKIKQCNSGDYENIMQKSSEIFNKWRMEPAPKRGEVVRNLANAFRKHKVALGKLISWEMGKIQAEGEGEVQEMIDIADYAVGLSRQLYGKTMHSERPNHRMYEQWHPLGTVGIVTAFNFPGAVWAWNAMIAAVCGDVMVWKPSSKTPLTAIAIQKIVNEVMTPLGWDGVMSLLVGSSRDVGELLVHDRRVPLVSATGSCHMGRKIGEAVAKRLGRSLLELGGNNAIIVMPDSDPELVLRAVLFGAVGTSGQRCTSTRRLFLHKSISASIIDKLITSYSQIKIGNPLDSDTLVGPLVDNKAVKEYSDALEIIKNEKGEILYGGNVIQRDGYYVEPTLVMANMEMEIVREETFAPILYIFEFEVLEEAIEAHNSVDQGLSSSIFTKDMQSVEKFLSHSGSDCGIANVNIGTSGAEIGGAFGGEKDTGGGREAGSDSWKAYMRRQTNTLNWSDDLPLAQGIEFG
ncbi:MAG: aldehyde dehydrogenase family protein [Candidatus Thermoplasmatota archaeon]|nr:aldehyde dehydrogenase family protein [Candidatus Thermoplasmatota archaeon]MEC7697854.1 aldehyde dehydrogenase family protein [Candidatus Thermoplasmatota archaeon]MEC7976683.1 aldehyde dehydrogenase family protein [Candidatus Thermoplasmatota archaeon]MEC8072982.1 aldehyde dehydrogenase family protein [Candidatus Thermoplasmatota archaeon]MEC8076740.1 aldehyde dehydrogenase family protein [Candidatus Thermoplasmatota archaeon]